MEKNREKQVILTYHTSMLAREEELEKLEKLYKRAEEGYGSICFISGPPGIGKSRLVNEFKDLRKQSSGILLAGGCVNQANKTPYRIFEEIIDEYIDSLEELQQWERDYRIRKVSK